MTPLPRDIAGLDELHDLRARAVTERQRARQETANARLVAEAAQADAERARNSVHVFQIQLHEARKKAEEAAAQLAAAQANLQAHEDRVAALMKGGGDAPAKPAFTLHVRTPLAAETTETIPLGTSMTVLDVFDTYATLNALRRKGGLSVWVVRGGKVMAVDLGAITKNSATATNYQVRNGDKLFVQVNVGK